MTIKIDLMIPIIQMKIAHVNMTMEKGVRILRFYRLWIARLENLLDISPASLQFTGLESGHPLLAGERTIKIFVWLQRSIRDNIMLHHLLHASLNIFRLSIV